MAIMLEDQHDQDLEHKRDPEHSVGQKEPCTAAQERVTVSPSSKAKGKAPMRWAKSCKHCLQLEWQSAKEAFWEIIHFIKTHKWKQTLRFLCRRKFWPWWFLLAVVIAASTVLSSYHNQIVEGMKPYGERIAKSSYAWIFPVILLIIVSFPPLFGHEIILLLCGMMWGLGVGFAIAAAGTFFGELACYVAFKYLFRARAAKLENKHILYACIAQLMRENGTGMLVLVRFSAMPGHLVTAIQSTIGIGVTRYAIAAFLTLPKQFSLVYIGRVYGETGTQVDPTKPLDHQTGEPLSDYYHKQKTKISLIVFAVTTLATLIAAYIVWQRARRIRPRVLAQMQERRKQAALELGIVTLESAEAPVSSRNSFSDEQPQPQRSMTFPEDTSNIESDPDKSRLSHRPNLTHKNSSARLLDSPSWTISTPPLPPSRGRSNTIEHLMLDSPELLNTPMSYRSRSPAYHEGGRSRSGTVSSSLLSRSPSLPHLPTYGEAQEIEYLPPATPGIDTDSFSAQTSRRASAVM